MASHVVDVHMLKITLAVLKVMDHVTVDKPKRLLIRRHSLHLMQKVWIAGGLEWYDLVGPCADIIGCRFEGVGAGGPATSIEGS
jgi:hypothetical protein